MAWENGEKPAWAIEHERIIAEFKSTGAHPSKRNITRYINSGISGEKLLRLVALHIDKIEKDAEERAHADAKAHYERRLAEIRSLT